MNNSYHSLFLYMLRNIYAMYVCVRGFFAVCFWIMIRDPWTGPSSPDEPLFPLRQIWSGIHDTGKCSLKLESFNLVSQKLERDTCCTKRQLERTRSWRDLRWKFRN